MQGTKEIIRIPTGHSFRLLAWDETPDQVVSIASPESRTHLAGEGTHWHYHLEMELTLICRGCGTRCVGNHVDSFGPGDLVLLGERLPHYWHPNDSSSGISVQWHFPGSHPLWAFPESASLEPFFRRASKGIRFCGRTASETCLLLQKLPMAKPAARLATFLLILGRLMEAPPAEAIFLSGCSFDLPVDDLHQAAMSRAVRYMVANFREAIRLEDVLHLTAMSRATFARQFKIHSGRSYSDFLNQLRLKAACQELSESSRSVVDIAYASGFSQISFFNRIFQRDLECTPSEFRRRAHAKKKQSSTEKRKRL